MNRRNFMKYLGGSSLAMLCDSSAASTLLASSAKPVSELSGQYNGSLRFNSDGHLKIVQFTDCHYKVDDKKNSQPTIDRMNEILDRERPDFIMYTGDIVVSCESFVGLDTVLSLAIDRNIPFGFVFGNHDDEYDHTRQELYDYIQKKPGALMPVRTADVAPDYFIPIMSSGNSSKFASILYCIDSHSYTKINSIPGYDWIKFDQISWYRKLSESLTRQNNGIPLPALAFFHIAIPEYHSAVQDGANRMFGIKGEGVCCPTTNSGFFTSAKECGDIMGMFVGHDHDNDYAVMYRDVLLAYGRYTGGNTVYNDIPNGARIINLYEGERKFDTYICAANGEINTRLTYPDTFIVKNVNR